MTNDNARDELPPAEQPPTDDPWVIVTPMAGPESKLGKDFFKVAERVAARAKELAAGSETVLEIS